MTDNTHTHNIVPKDLSDTKGLANFLKKKNERLASAVYLVTEYVSDNDPLKWKLRNLALEILSLSAPVGDSRGAGEDLLGSLSGAKLSHKISEILSLIEVALASGSVSQMNFTLLKKEYAKFLSLASKLSGQNHWGAYLLDRESDQVSSLPGSLATATNQSVQQTAPVESIGHNYRSMSYKNISDKSPSPRPKETTHKTQAKGHSFKTDNRQETIISFLRHQDWMSIKDISGAIPDVSTKTIQRELTEMVDQGILKKKGERRWSRYKLNGHHGL